LNFSFRIGATLLKIFAGDIAKTQTKPPLVRLPNERRLKMSIFAKCQSG